MIRKSLMNLPIFWMLLFFVFPLSILLVFSFLQRGTYGGVEWTLDFSNYARIGNHLYLNVFINSFFLAVRTTVVCLLLGVPLAFFMVIANPKVRPILMFAIVLPFLSNFLIRAYATKNLLNSNGLLSSLWYFFEQIGFANLVNFMQSGPVAVQLGMIANYLPLMVLPLYVGFEKFDFSLFEAAKDLGANSGVAFFKVFLPNVKSSLASATMIVFIPCLGEFIIPDLLGGAQIQTLGKLISDQFLKTRDWPFGAALSILLLSLLMLFQWLEVQFAKARDKK